MCARVRGVSSRVHACVTCNGCRAAQVDRFYIVEEGELKGSKAGVEHEVCPRITRGGYFGELALLNDKVRARARVGAPARRRCARVRT